MKKIYLALMCMASLSMMTACSGDKKGDKDKAAEEENKEVVEQQDQDAEATEAEEQANADEGEQLATPEQAEPLDVAALYAAGDFKPAATAIFEDDLKAEKDGELPSKWDVLEGSAEVTNVAGRNLITLSGGSSKIVPMVGSDNSNFLPETFTIEFEYFANGSSYTIALRDTEGWDIDNILLWTLNTLDWNIAKNNDESIYGNKPELFKLEKKNGWNHFALSYDKGNLKIFINGKRQANLPNCKQPACFTIYGQDANGSSHFITNIRVMK